MEKEIEIFDFVLKEQRKRQIEKGMVNNDQNIPFEHEILAQVELDKRKEKNTDREIFKELDLSEKNKENKLSKKTIIKLAIYAATALTTSLVIVKACEYQSQPVKIVVKEMATKSGFSSIFDLDNLNGNMTDEEILKLVTENNLTKKQILKEMDTYGKLPFIDEKELKEEVVQNYPEVFITR